MSDIRIGDEFNLPVTIVGKVQSDPMWNCRFKNGGPTFSINTSVLEAAERLPRKLAVGDRVRYIDGDGVVTILAVKDDDAWVECGDLRWTVRLENLRLADPRNGERTA